MSNNKDKFKIFLPQVEIKKALDSKGKKIMKVCGIASTMDVDAENQIVDPNGFDCSYLMSSGFINWHHGIKDKPATIIGEPLKVEIKNNQMYVEAILYDWSPLAREIYQIAENLEKGGTNRRLGWSIEGKARAKNALNENHITKSMITGIAITPMPVNNKTSLTILKGMDAEMEDFEYDIDTVESSVNGGKVEYIIDIVKENGDRLTVDKQLNVKLIQKAMSTDSSAGVLIKESLEQQNKHLVTLYKAYKAGKIPKQKFNKLKKAVKDKYKKP